MTERLEIPMIDTTKIPLGPAGGPTTTYCDPDEVAAFALAINDDRASYQDGTAAPPTYALVPGLPMFIGASRGLQDALAGAGSGGHGEHELFLRKPIVPGMTLHTTAERWAAVTSKAGVNIFIRLLSTDDAGEPVIEQFWSSIYLGEHTGGDQGPQMPDHTFLDDYRAKPIASVTLGTTRDQTFRYAGGSGDRSAIHVNDTFAKAMGVPGKFNQGALTLGISTKALVDVAAGGDARRVKRLAVRFARYAFPGNDVQVDIYDAGETEDGGHAYAFESISGGQTVLRHGRIEVS